MFEILIEHFKKSFTPTGEEISLIKRVLFPSYLKKGEFLLREGEIPKYAAFVCRGLLRSYVIDNKGKEHIVQFAPENWWISAKPGAKEDSPSTVFIDAIEDSDLLLIDRGGHTVLMEKVPGYAASFLAGMQKRGEVKEKRIVDSMSATAEERYNDFIASYPNIAQRVPQHMLGAYLGIAPETISRIRKRSLPKK